MIGFEELLAAPAPPPDHRIAYGAGPLQYGELRLPAGSASRPVVVLIHGGCWRAAYDVGHVAAAAAALASAGFATWVPEYRRVGNEGGGWPGTFEDVALAVDHVRALARRFPQLDTGRVVFAGHSAGGHLALWAASRRIGDVVGGGAVNEPPLRPAGVVSLAGITDLRAYASTSGCGSAVVPLLGGTAAEVPGRYDAVSPVSRVPLGVPVRFVHGGADRTVPLAQSSGFRDLLRANGGDAELSAVEGAGHFDVVAPWSAAWPAVVAAVRALAGP